MLPSEGRGVTSQLAELCKLSHDMCEVLIDRHHLHILVEPILCPFLAFPQKCCHSSESKNTDLRENQTCLSQKLTAIMIDGQ